MEFRNQHQQQHQQHQQQHDDLVLSSSSLYGPSPSPQLRASAFSKPTLPTSSSLLSPKPTQTPPPPPQAARNGAIFSTPPLTTTTTATDHSAQPFAKVTHLTPITTTTTTDDHEPIKYRECLRNHAASIGGHVMDGCGEFMPGTSDPLKCAACSCHRSFHRKETDGETTASSYYRSVASPAALAGSGGRAVPLLLPPPHRIRKQFNLPGLPSSPTSRAMPLGGNPSGSGGTTTESSSEERMNAAAITPTGAPAGAQPQRKRFRTKFSAEQKAKMMEFAERIGWRIQRQDEGVVDHFCDEVGVRRQVFKVWIHNNKSTVKKHAEGMESEQHYEGHSDLQSPPALQQ